MRKKLVVTLLAASMMGSMLAGCGGGSGTSGEEGKESSKREIPLRSCVWVRKQIHTLMLIIQLQKIF